MLNLRRVVHVFSADGPWANGRGMLSADFCRPAFFFCVEGVQRCHCFLWELSLACRAPGTRAYCLHSGDYKSSTKLASMKHNERARVAPLYLTFTHPYRTQKKMQRAHHAHALRLGVLFACSLWSAFSGLALSAHLDPSACSLNARGARSLTNSALLPELARCASFLKSLVF